MKKLLRDTRTGLYLKSPGQWTDDPDDAIDFHFSDRAIEYARTWDLSEVEVAFQEPGYSAPAQVPALRLAA